MILFDADYTDFSSQGICTIRDISDPSVEEGLNDAFELSFDVSIDSKAFKEIQFRRIVLCKPNPHDNPQPFRIYSISTPINRMVTVLAEHISYDTVGYPIPPFEVSSATQMASVLSSNSVIPSLFKFTTDIQNDKKIKVDVPSSIRSLMGGVVLPEYNGDFEYDCFNVKFNKRRGLHKDIVLKYGVNLTDLRQEENIANLYTDVYPYWTNHGNNHVPIVKTLPEKLVPTDGDWNFKRVIVYDMSSEFDEEPTHDQMRARTKQYITDEKIGIPKISLDVSYVQLANESSIDVDTSHTDVRLGDTISVRFEKANVNATARCIKTTYNPITNRYTAIELGDPKSNIASTIANTDKKLSRGIMEVKHYTDKVVDKVVGEVTGNADLINTGTLKSIDSSWFFNINTGDYGLGDSNALANHTKSLSRWRHRNGETTEADMDGLRVHGRPYLNKIFESTNVVNGSIAIELPPDWKNRTFVVLIQPTAMSANNNSIVEYQLEVASVDTINGSFIVNGFVLDSNSMKHQINFKYTVIGG